MESIPPLLDRGIRVIDLSADYRLRDAAVYQQWYKEPHHDAANLAHAVYGLPEVYGDRINSAKLIANPGCYPQTAILGLAPLVANRLVELTGIVVDSKSGVSGGGRTPKLGFHFPECNENFAAYAVGTHRHTPEIEQTLSAVAKTNVTVTFTPTLVPMTRGILSTIYVRPAKSGLTAEALVSAARAYYERSPSVSVLDAGMLPDTLWVRGSNRAHVAYAIDARADRIVAMGTIDNLVKGASGQAVQCMNLALGWDEAMGLAAPASWP
jgi:N-acetyl-gamma-glutamyl-phosphate reductase